MNRHYALVGTALVAALALAGCKADPPPPQTTGQKVDAAIEKTQDSLEAARKSAEEAVSTAGEAISDTAITAAVKTQLAADPDLRMLDISVETEAGRTALRGTAPDAAARDRATRIAEAVKGVTSVDNQLTVKP